MEYKVKGTMATICPTETGTTKAGKEWKKLIFTVTNNDGYEGREMLYAFEVFGAEKVENFAKYNKEGSEVEVKFDIRTNEYNGKYYTSLAAFRVDKLESTPQPIEEDSDQLPF